MWLDLKSPDNCPSRYKRIIRHEFGHALGLKHEHQHPDAPPLTDPGKLREYLRQCYPGFTSEQVEKKIRAVGSACRGSLSEEQIRQGERYALSVSITFHAWLYCYFA